MAIEANVDDESKLTKPDGTALTLAELKGTAGAVEFAYAGHVVKYDGESSITVDGEKHQVKQLPLHLDMNKMACCIGDTCIMWPQ
eukprot:m.450768 g.450768  ORF g.450768 m.450768 type:complete len:85 (-) comp20046_c0_seq1:230-484(-)